MDKLKEIRERYATGYTMARYGTRDAIHQQMSEDIHTLIHLVKKLNLQSVNNNEVAVCNCTKPQPCSEDDGRRWCFICGKDIAN